MPDDTFIQSMPPLPEQLVFILGPHRSGTTYLHQILADTGSFDFISYYDIVEFPRLVANYNAGISADSIQQLQYEIDSFGENRWFDQMPIGALKAEEYGYILSRGPFNIHTSSPISNTDFEPLKSLCQKKRLISSGTKPLLLKNPNDFYDGSIRITDSFPTSKILFIHRHPLHVFNSQIRVWRNLLEKRNPWFAKIDATYAEIHHKPELKMAFKISLLSGRGLMKVMETLCNAYSFYLESISQLNSDQALSIRYEDLCRAPQQSLQQVMHFLDLELEGGHLLSEPSPRNIPVIPEVAQIYLQNSIRLAPYLSHLGYNIMPDDH